MKWTLSKALAFIQAHRKGSCYVVKDQQDEKLLREALLFVFEENAHSYIMNIKKG